jgi:hypothetical protein
MIARPLFDIKGSRAYRWRLELVESGEIIDQYWSEEDRYIYWFIDLESAGDIKRRTWAIPRHDWTIAEFINTRRQHIGFLTTSHRNFYEYGKYTEVLNDPVNYITAQPTDMDEAFDQAQKRIGNYRMGARRNILHLGGTFDDDMLDDLSSITATDFHPTASLSFPFFPKLPADYTKSARVNLITTDLGYVNMINSMHPADTTPVAVRSEQGNAFRRIIYGQGNQTDSSATLTDAGMVKIVDIETVLDAAMGTDLHSATGVTTFLPAVADAGEDLLVNIPGQHIIRSEPAGLSLEMYTGATLSSLTTSIDMPKSSGNIILTAGSAIITITKDGAISIDDGSYSITVGTSSIVATDGSVSLTISGGVVDVS